MSIASIIEKVTNYIQIVTNVIKEAIKDTDITVMLSKIESAGGLAIMVGHHTPTD